MSTSPQQLQLVTVKSCAPSANHDVEITGTVTNTNRVPTTYTIQLEIRAKSGKPLYFTAASAKNVPPHKTASWSAATTAKDQSGMTCVTSGLSQGASP